MHGEVMFHEEAKNKSETIWPNGSIWTIQALQKVYKIVDYITQDNYPVADTWAENLARNTSSSEHK